MTGHGMTRTMIAVGAALLAPLAALLAQPASPAKAPATAAAPDPVAATADTMAVDTINYEGMALPDNDRDYWSLEYYDADDQGNDGEWEENRREREGQGGDEGRDQGERSE